jgi:ATP-dependent RNA helicase DeaD
MGARRLRSAPTIAPRTESVKPTILTLGAETAPSAYDGWMPKAKTTPAAATADAASPAKPARSAAMPATGAAGAKVAKSTKAATSTKVGKPAKGPTFDAKPATKQAKPAKSAKAARPAADRAADDRAVDVVDEPAAPEATVAVDPSPTEGLGDGFAAFDLDPRLLATVAGLGYEEPTPIQREAIPHLLAGRDLLAEAPTGTGKTAAFALPTLQRIAIGEAGPGRARALVIVPTRELAMQVAEAFHAYGKTLGARIVPVYGGQPISQQLRGLRRGVDVVVATPGRAVDHIKRGSLLLDEVDVVVLDEADEMLDMGFAEDLDTILSATPGERQTALFSATISPTITRIAKRHLRDPARLSVKAERPAGDGVALVRQTAYVTRRMDKLAALCRILDVEDPTSTLVFARTRGEVDTLAEALSSRGHDAGALHGGLTQDQRDRMMARFRDQTLDVLVATDVAARGLDIDHVSHVVNYDVPSDPDAYVHRIGRTGRAGREGVAITLVEPREHRLLRNIEAATKSKLQIARLPSVADLRERRLELLRANLRDALETGGHDRLRGVVEPLSEEFDVVDIALAAVSLIEGAATRDEDEVEIAQAFLGPAPGGQGGPGPRGRSGPPQFGPGPRRGPGGPGGFGGPGGYGPPRGQGGPGGPPRAPRGPEGEGWAQLWIGGGRRAGIRPGDLVGAIANEAGVPGSVVGAIQLFDDHSLVDVLAHLADPIASALRNAGIRGQKFPVRQERTPSRR